MKTRKLLKRISAFIMVFAIVFGLFGTSGNIAINIATAKVNAATAGIKMYCYDAYFSDGVTTKAYIYVQVNGSVLNQQVEVYYKEDNGLGYVWSNKNADYFTTLSDGSQIWRADIESNAMEYAIKYVVNGQVYWDTNDGNNYVHEDKLGSAVMRANRLPYQDASDIATQGFKVEAILKNFGYGKVVKVRYTEDNWATYGDISLSYSSSDTSRGTEVWSGTLPLDYSKKDDLQYVLYYQVNGQVIGWENNFGSNYDINYYLEQ